ncbi:hypothetical protein PhCBS80983_g06415 [Powellomyces hirtus]|uniref:Chromo domain-containing protein n=1 Tax=Powellomyces hirtus TaxID=109895 RepID=A0A507DMU7_9FUNG|nr:hypothetical protein PhCBS80983_g06415 [Powellomyces hirtus]
MIQVTKFVTRKYLDYSGSNWREFLLLVEFCLNSIPQRHLNGLTPFEIELNRVPRPPGWNINPKQLAQMTPPNQTLVRLYQERAADINLTVQQALRDEQDCYEQYFNQGRTPIAFEIGDLVDLNCEQLAINFNLVKPANLTPKWIGPFTISAKGPHPDTYRLDLSQTTPPPPEPILIEGELEYPVKAILNKTVTGRGRTRRRMFLTKYIGWPEPSWQPEANLKDTEAFEIWREPLPVQAISRTSPSLTGFRSTNLLEGEIEASVSLSTAPGADTIWELVLWQASN